MGQKEHWTVRHVFCRGGPSGHNRCKRSCIRSPSPLWSRSAYEADTAQVFANYAFTIMKASGSLDWMTEARFSWTWPSWAPKMGDRLKWPRPPRVFAASGDCSLPPQFALDGLDLKCVGTFVGRIVNAGALRHPSNPPIAPHPYGNPAGLRTAAVACLNAMSPDSQDPGFFDIPWHVNIANLVADVPWLNQAKVLHASDEVNRFRREHAGWQLWGHRLQDLFPVANCNHKEAMAMVLRAVFLCQRDLGTRTLFVTDTGYLGSVELNVTDGEEVEVRPDMEIWVLLGCSWPVILYRAGEKYRLIGKCYVHGIMNGKFVQNQNLSREIISLS